MNLVNITRYRPRIFLGWWMVAVAGFMSSINNTAHQKGATVFLLPVSEGLNVSRASISLVYSLSRSEGGPVGPIAGWLIDRVGPKSVLFVGTIITGLGFLLLAHTNNIWSFGLVYLAMITIGSDVAFQNGLSALVNNWFIRRRGLAMSSYQAIHSLGPALLIPLLGLLIALEGWRTASTVAGATILGVVLPLSFLVRNTPEGSGLLPDGRYAEPPSAAQDQGSEVEIQANEVRAADFDLVEAIHTPAYWILMSGTWLRITAKSGVILHIIPILVWKGMEEQSAAYIFGVLLFLMVPIHVVAGWLADIFPKNLVLSIAAVSGTAAYFLLASPWTSLWIIYLFVVLLAISETSGSINWATIGDYFGRKAFGRLRGIIQFAAAPGIFLAPVFAGWWYDREESYALPLWVFTIILAVGALSFGLMRKPRKVQ